MSKIKMIELTEHHLDIVLSWRNDPKVRENMYTYHEISTEEHQNWFETLSNDHARKYFVCELDDELCGLIGYTQIDLVSRSASWVFYSGDTNKRGIGSMMEVAALDYAFDVMKLHKLNCEVLEFNESVIKFHKKHGFKVEGRFKKHYFKNDKYWDIYRLAIFAKDWLNCRTDIVGHIKGPYSVGKQFHHEFTISDDQIMEFAKVTGDNNSIHLNDESASKLGFSGKISHGFLTSSIFSKVFGTLFPGEGTIYLDQSLKFLKPVYPNTPLIASFKVLSKIGKTIIVETNIINKNSDSILVIGQATVIIPVSSDEV